MDKQTLRRHFRQILSNIPEQDRKNAAHLAKEQLAKQFFYQESNHIACYLAYKNEIDSKSIIELIWQQQKKCYLPIIMENKTLSFMPYQSDTDLTPNRFGILEPTYQPSLTIPPQEMLDIILVPLLAFDRKGHRLGTGGGYYDRTFAFLHQNQAKGSKNIAREKKMKDFLLIGLAYSEQEADFLPHDPWDISLDGILTEKECLFFK